MVGDINPSVEKGGEEYIRFLVFVSICRINKNNVGGVTGVVSCTEGSFLLLSTVSHPPLRRGKKMSL